MELDQAAAFFPPVPDNWRTAQRWLSWPDELRLRGAYPALVFWHGSDWRGLAMANRA